GLPADLLPRAPTFIQVCSIEDEGVVAVALARYEQDRVGLRISPQAFGVAPIDVVLPFGDENVVVADVLVEVD
ncbi:MAG: hypothetical protein KC656_34500, partial [Myxococcales bacterium]|nr:hypothetical protein [Myxococcales bacterium]